MGRGDGERGRVPFANGAGTAPGLLNGTQQIPGQRFEMRPRQGQPRPLGTPPEQGGADPILERADTAAERRL